MTDNKIDKIPNMLKDFFAKRGITQENIAQDLGVSQAYVSAMLNGKPFGKNTAKKWGELYGIQPSWLLTGEGDMLKSIEIDLNEPIGSDTLRDVIKMLEKDKEDLLKENQILKDELLECRKKLIELLDKK